MDTTIQYALEQIAKVPNLHYKKTKFWYKIIKDEIDTYRSTGYLLKDRNVSGWCNHQANFIEKQLINALRVQ